MGKVSEEKRKEAQNAREFLNRHLKRGDTVYTLVRHHTATGSRRSISLLIGRDRDIIDLTWALIAIADYKHDNEHGGVKTTGYGSDVVHNLACALFCPDEYDTEAANSLKEWRL